MVSTGSNDTGYGIRDKIRGVRSIAQLVPSVVVQLLRASPLSDGKVTFAWRTAVGQALERATSVKLEDSVLLVDTDSAQWSKEVTRSSGIILSRLQEFLGKDVVTRIVVRTSPRA